MNLGKVCFFGNELEWFMKPMLWITCLFTLLLPLYALADSDAAQTESIMKTSGLFFEFDVGAKVHTVSETMLYTGRVDPAVGTMLGFRSNKHVLGLDLAAHFASDNRLPISLFYSGLAYRYYFMTRVMPYAQISFGYGTGFEVYEKWDVELTKRYEVISLGVALGFLYPVHKNVAIGGAGRIDIGSRLGKTNDSFLAPISLWFSTSYVF